MSNVKQLYGATEAINLLREIVQDFGADYLNTEPYSDVSCTYADDSGNPSCIAGHALYRAAPEAFAAVREYEYSRGSSEVFNRIPTTVGVQLPFTPLATMVIRRAQTIQDNGQSWGIALDEAIGYAITERGKYPDKEGD